MFVRRRKRKTRPTAKTRRRKKSRGREVGGELDKDKTQLTSLRIHEGALITATWTEASHENIWWQRWDA